MRGRIAVLSGMAAVFAAMLGQAGFIDDPAILAGAFHVGFFLVFISLVLTAFAVVVLVIPGLLLFGLVRFIGAIETMFSRPKPVTPREGGPSLAG